MGHFTGLPGEKSTRGALLGLRQIFCKKVINFYLTMLFNAIFCYNYLILFTFWCFFMVIAVVKKSSAPVPVPVQRKGRRGSLDAIAGAGRAAVAAVGSTARRKREKLRKTVAHYYPQGFKIPKLHPD